MDEMERFACTVPAGPVIKKTEITCFGTAPDNYEVFGSVTDWLLVGLTALLVLGAFLAWKKAQQTLERMEADAGAADERFFRDIMLRERHEGERRTDAAMSGLVASASDLVAATNYSLPAVLKAGMELRKANLSFVLTFELQKGQGSLEQFCTCLVVLAKSTQIMVESKRARAKTMANSGFEHLFQSVLALHRGDIDMPDFLDGLYTFVEEVARNHKDLIPNGDWQGERIVDKV